MSFQKEELLACTIARLIAEAREIKQGRRAGFYQVNVTSEVGALVAQVHCVAHRVSSSSVGAEDG